MSRTHVCPDPDHCVVCTATSRVEAASAANTEFQRMSRPMEGETDEQRHWRLSDTRERYEASHTIWWALKSIWHSRIPEVNWAKVVAPFHKGRKVAEAFEAMPNDPSDPNVIRSYAALMEVVQAQEMVLKTLGITVDYVDEAEPYNTAVDQAKDVIENGHIKIATISVWPDSYHPVLSNERGGDYDRFRFVHDVIGHCATGTGFDRHGEYVSWLFHSLLCGDDLACAAISTELHGENSFLWVKGRVAPHKAGLLPVDLRNPHDDIAVVK